MPSKIPKVLDKHIRHSVSQGSKRETQDFHDGEGDINRVELGQLKLKVSPADKRSRSVSPLGRPVTATTTSTDLDYSLPRPDPVKFRPRKCRASDPDVSLAKQPSIAQSRGMATRVLPFASRNESSMDNCLDEERSDNIFTSASIDDAVHEQLARPILQSACAENSGIQGANDQVPQLASKYYWKSAVNSSGDETQVRYFIWLQVSALSC